MIGYRFAEYIPPADQKSTFERLLDIFMQLMVHTSGDVDEALNWMTQLDRKYNLTTPEYGMGDFIDDLKKEGYIKDDAEGNFELTGKSEKTIRKNSLE
ncbi:MAG: hypothetical protein AAF570_15125, partial [Bacteroidota bacterium]